MDPEWYLKSIGIAEETETLGVRHWFELLRQEFPSLRFGYFNPQVGTM
jgi:hypothetical protein